MWRRAREAAKAGMKPLAQRFLETRGQDLTIPIEVDIFLVGFQADGGYAWRLNPERLSSMLAGSMPNHCPSSWESEEELGVCFQINYQVVDGSNRPEVANLLHQLETRLRSSMTETHSVYDDRLSTGKRRFYSVEASKLEPMFEDFMDQMYPGLSHRSHRDASLWHQHNVIFVVNPDKVRMNPATEGEEDEQRSTPDLVGDWRWGELDAKALAAEEGDYVYRYKYGGTGEGTSWISAANYVVVDVAAGPTTYGPAISRSGSVGSSVVPSLRESLRAIFDELESFRGQKTAMEQAGQTADETRTTLFAAELAAELMAAVRHVFTPDMASQHLEWARTVVVPLVVISDHDQPEAEEQLESELEHTQFWGINITQVEGALQELLDAGQQGLVITSNAHLHQHPRLAAALRKAMRSRSQAVLDRPQSSDYPASDVGVHVATHTFLDAEALLEELEVAADVLTQGLVGAAQYGGGDDDAPVQQLRHEGTRVVPVFVFALQDTSHQLVLSNRDLVVANHDMVVALQLRSGAAWGVPDNVWTGHMANGRRVETDARDSTRHVIAGLAQAVAGVLPPYARWDVREGRVEYDWRWAVGATPFGPYSNFSGVSEMAADIASRNMLLSHLAAALRHMQGRMDALDDFVEEHFTGPWGAGNTDPDSRRHWLDTVASTRHGFNRTLRSDVVQHLEASLANITSGLEALSMHLFTQDWTAAERSLSEGLLPQVGALARELDAQLAAGEEVMQCCLAAPRTGVQRALLTVLACAAGAAVFFALVIVAVVARGQAKRAARAIGLPTYGLPTGLYSLGTSRLGAFSPEPQRSHVFAV